jgi:hypothetical protein
MDSQFKARVLEAFAAACRDRLHDAQREISSLEDASRGETKSSAGDKYETAREMFAQALDLHRRTRESAAADLEWLDRQDPSVPRHAAGAGALVLLDGAWILIGPVPLSVPLDGTAVQGVSTRGPLGAVLKGERVGEAREFRGRTIRIEAVL